MVGQQRDLLKADFFSQGRHRAQMAIVDWVKSATEKGVQGMRLLRLVGIGDTRRQRFAAKQHRQGFQLRPNRLAVVFLEGELNLRQQVHRLPQLLTRQALQSLSDQACGGFARP
ncbi:Uncharacterised protein [Serratia fonticola]|uniref:Uncharacterized protein n=1 Tax=Serratia fonticola TaxID=47917 RepID=A0A4U9TTS0_SERFO|nr:Uncharacterised protein [Serratia fonticola]